jgi:hypothetical protein
VGTVHLSLSSFFVALDVTPDNLGCIGILVLPIAVNDVVPIRTEDCPTKANRLADPGWTSRD